MSPLSQHQLGEHVPERSDGRAGGEGGRDYFFTLTVNNPPIDLREPLVSV